MASLINFSFGEYINRSSTHEITINLIPMNIQRSRSDCIMPNTPIFSHKQLKNFLVICLSPYWERFSLYKYIFWWNPHGISTYIYYPSYRDECIKPAVLLACAVSKPSMRDGTIISLIVVNCTTGGNISKIPPHQYIDPPSTKRLI